MRAKVFFSCMIWNVYNFPQSSHLTFLFRYSDFLCLIFDLRVVYDSYQQVREFLKSPLVWKAEASDAETSKTS